MSRLVGKSLQKFSKVKSLVETSPYCSQNICCTRKPSEPHTSYSPLIAGWIQIDLLCLLEGELTLHKLLAVELPTNQSCRRDVRPARLMLIFALGDEIFKLC